MEQNQNKETYYTLERLSTDGSIKLEVKLSKTPCNSPEGFKSLDWSNILVNKNIYKQICKPGTGSFLPCTYYLTST